MKCKNKIISIVLAIAIIGLLIPVGSVFVLGGVTPTISVQNQTGKAGEEVEVDIMIKNNSGVSGATLQVEYDSKLTLQSVENGEALDEFVFTKPAKYDNHCKFLWDSESGMSQKDGKLLILHFLISDQVDQGDELPIHISYVEGDIFDEDLENVNFNLVNGCITVSGVSSGENTDDTDEPEGENGQNTSPADSAITVESVTGKAGETVDMNVVISNNPGIAGATLQVQYDPKLVLQNVLNGVALDTLTFTKPESLNNPCKFLWDSESGMSQKDGVLLKLQFLLSDQASVGDEFPVRILYEEGDVFDENLENVSLKLIEGKISVIGDSICDKDGHKYKSTVIAPTCMEKGYTEYVCTACGDTYRDDETDFIPHKYKVVNTVNSTCTDPERTTYKCEICSKAYTKETAKANGHAYKTSIVKATLSKDGIIKKVCTECGNVSSAKMILHPKTFMIPSVVYTGKNLKPKIVVKDSKGNIIPASNYTVTYKDNIKIGKGTSTITFKGLYSGKVSKTFDIIPKATNIVKVSAKSKGFTVKWKKQTNQTSGYQIQYATNKSFKSAKVRLVNKNKTTQLTLSKLKAKKKYYVRIRTYTTVRVNGKKVKIYSGWSKAKGVTTK